MERHLGKNIRIISNQIRRRAEKEIAKAGIDLPSTQARILGFIYRESFNRDIFQKDIEEEFDIRRSSATNILQLLEKGGYIERESVANDGRLKKIIITDKGKGIHEIVIEGIKGLEESLMSIYTKEELEILFGLLDKLSNSLCE